MFSPLLRCVTALAILGASTWANAACERGQVVRQGDTKALATTEAAAGNTRDIDAALRAVVPAGWSVDNPDHVKATVQWGSGRSVDATLAALTQQANACLTIDATTRRLTLRKAVAADMPGVDESLLLAKEPAKAESKAPAPTTPSAPAMAAAPVAHAKPVAAAAPAAPKSVPATPAAAATTSAPASVPAAAAKTVATAPAAPAAASQPASAPRPVRTQPDDAPIAALPNDLLAAVNTAEGSYDLRAGETLRQAMQRWTKNANWTLVWRADVDFEIDAPIAFPQGTSLQEAVRLTMKSFWSRSQTLTATVYKNQVLLIAARNTP